MNNTRTLLVTLAVLIILVSASLACNLPAISPGNSPEPANQPSQPAEQAESIAPSTGQSTSVSLTESQINTMIEQLLAQDNTLNDLQVRLQENKITLTGRVNQGNLLLPLSAELNVFADGQGGIDVQINSAMVGPLPIPQSMRSQFENQLNQGLDPLLANITQGMRIETVAIGNGVVTITGTLP